MGISYKVKFRYFIENMIRKLQCLNYYNINDNQNY